MKRTSSVALVLMGTAMVGGLAYWGSRPDCRDHPPGSQAAEQCQSSSSTGRSTSHGYYGGSSDSSSRTGAGSAAAFNASRQTGTVDSARSGISTTPQRGGFGSIGHAFSGGS